MSLDYTVQYNSYLTCAIEHMNLTLQLKGKLILVATCTRDYCVKLGIDGPRENGGREAGRLAVPALLE